jgi:coenzyme F420-reducing hydrogenase delta subunit/Pyruvate/2-oxoacid:ferredoxin oxidoreductase delta subunit
MFGFPYMSPHNYEQTVPHGYTLALEKSMKLTFMIDGDNDSSHSLDLSHFNQGSNSIIRLKDSVEGINEIPIICASKKPASIVLIAKDPLRFRDDHQIGLLQKLITIGINPASIGFVNLNGITLCSDNEDQILARLQLSTDLAHGRVAHGKPLSMEKVEPIKRCLVIGELLDNDATLLAQNGIELIHIWPENTKETLSDIELQAFSGLPGEYHIRLLQANNRAEEHSCGAVVVNTVSLSPSQKLQLAEAMKIPLPGDMFRLPPDRQSLTTGVWILEKDNEQQATEWVQEISSFLSQDTIELYLDTCTVNLDKCGLCGTCVKTCMFSANSIDLKSGKIHFDQTRCTGCGNCVTACPVLARDLHHYSNSYMANIANNLHTFQGRDGIRILALFCENNGYKAVNHITGAGKRVSSSYYFLPVKCGARIGTEIIPDSFRNGFDGVALLVCARDECNELVGSLDLERRFNLYRTIMKAQGQESGRMRIFSVKEKELGNIHDGLEQFTKYLNDLRMDQEEFSQL